MIRFANFFVISKAVIVINKNRFSLMDDSEPILFRP